MAPYPGGGGVYRAPLVAYLCRPRQSVSAYQAAMTSKLLRRRCACCRGALGACFNLVVHELESLARAVAVDPCKKACRAAGELLRLAEADAGRSVRAGQDLESMLPMHQACRERCRRRKRGRRSAAAGGRLPSGARMRPRPPSARSWGGRHCTRHGAEPRKLGEWAHHDHFRTERHALHPAGPSGVMLTSGATTPRTARHDPALRPVAAPRGHNEWRKEAIHR